MGNNTFSPNKFGRFKLCHEGDWQTYFAYIDPCLRVSVFSVGQEILLGHDKLFYQHSLDKKILYIKINDGYIQAYQWGDGKFKRVCMLKIAPPKDNWICLNKKGINYGKGKK